MNLKWLLVFILFAALCVAAMRAQAEGTIGNISANVVSDVATMSQDSDTGQIVVDAGSKDSPLFMDCGYTDNGATYQCNF